MWCAQHRTDPYMASLVGELGRGQQTVSPVVAASHEHQH